VHDTKIRDVLRITGFLCIHCRKFAAQMEFLILDFGMLIYVVENPKSKIQNLKY